MEAVDRIRNRQLARLLSHLKKTGQLTPELESDIKRAYRYAFEDISILLQGLDKENNNGESSN